MASTVYSDYSPYKNTTKFENKYLDILVTREIPKSADDILYAITSTYQHRPDRLAADLYGNPGLWWVFAMRNRNTLVDPIWDFRTGTQIFLPKKSMLQTVLGI
jgi:hypothetical protein